MRNPERLDKFYSEIMLLHKKYCPDLRIGQLFSNYFDWLTTKGKEYYYMEEGQFLAFLKEYLIK